MALFTIMYVKLLVYFIFWLYHMVCRTLVPQQGIEATTLPPPTEVEAQRPNHWTTREFPELFISALPV